MLWQFLSEAVMLALIGGLLGVGVTGAMVVTKVSKAFTAVVRPTPF